MLETVSVFDAMELDNTHHRVASRRALALAHNRVERNLGSFLRGAKNEEEFFERLGLVQEDFTGYVTTAAAEVGHEHPEHIAESLRDHYRQAAQPVQFQETPEEKLEEEKEEAEEKASAVQIAPKKVKKTLKRMAKSGRTWTNAQAAGGKQGSPLGSEPVAFGQNDQGQYPVLPGDEAHHTCPGCGSVNHRTNPQTGEPECLDCGYTGSENPYGAYSPESDINHRQRDLGGYGGRDAKTADSEQGYNPGTQQDPAKRKVTCPECGGSGKTAGNSSCGKCGGNGKVENFGDPVAQAYTSRTADGQGQPFPLDPNQPFPGGQGGRPNHVRILQEQGRQAPPMPTTPILDAQGNPVQPETFQHPDPWMDNEPGTTTFPPEWNVPGGLTDGLRGPHTGAENQNNTDLDGPEPKMDKAEWTRTNPGQPDYKDGPRHPTEKKDITQVIGPMRNYDRHEDIKEIHGQGTHFKNETLPNNSGDAGYDGGGPGPAPHTDTFGNDGQVNPVTDQSLEAVQSNVNPLSELLMAEWPSEQVVTAALLQP